MSGIRERLESRINRTDTCWLWTGQLNNRGYGLFWFQGRKRCAHAVMWELLIGPIPEGLQIDHLCRVKECVNPAHLEPVTPAENMRRMAVLQTSCRREGHDWTDPRNVYVSPGGSRRCRECARIRDRRPDRLSTFRRKQAA